MRALLALFAPLGLFLWWLCTPMGMVFAVIATPFLVIAEVNHIITGPMSDSDVPHFVTAGRLVQGRHATGGSFGDVVTIAITNTHTRRETPANLWVACTVFGQAMRDTEFLGNYETLRAFEAQAMIDYNGDPKDQVVLASTTKNLDFDTQAALPDLNLGTGERVGQCVAGATKKQALALAGYNMDDPHAQLGRNYNLTPMAKNLGMQNGWQK